MSNMTIAVSRTRKAPGRSLSRRLQTCVETCRKPRNRLVRMSRGCHQELNYSRMLYWAEALLCAQLSGRILLQYLLGKRQTTFGGWCSILFSVAPVTEIVRHLCKTSDVRITSLEIHCIFSFQKCKIRHRRDVHLRLLTDNV